MIQDLNTNNSTIIRANNEMSDPVGIRSGVRQGNSLSPMLFNLIMDKRIDQLPKHLGYKLGDISIPVVSYADDAVLLAERIYRHS